MIRLLDLIARGVVIAASLAAIALLVYVLIGSASPRTWDDDA